MDNRTVVSYGMLLALVALAIVKGSLDAGATKEILISLVSGTLGYMAHRYTSPTTKPPKPTPSADDQSGKVRVDVK